jgi:hypothetical protein
VAQLYSRALRSLSIASYDSQSYSGDILTRLHTGTKVEVTLGLTISQSVCIGIKHPCGTCDQILLPVGMVLSEICGLISVGRPL